MSERLRAIVDHMKIRPGDLVLEIGCGHGVAATYVCQKLKHGRLTAIDRSPKMVEAAKKRNTRFVTDGRADFVVAEFEHFDPGPIRYDKILAVRVALFHWERDRAMTLARRWLKPGGTIVVEYDEPR